MAHDFDNQSEKVLKTTMRCGIKIMHTYIWNYHVSHSYIFLYFLSCFHHRFPYSRALHLETSLIPFLKYIHYG
jgi:hypothetical protein